MKIIAIVGSTRRGNTYAMVEASCLALEACNVELLHLKSLDINRCDGCLKCDKTGECHIKDDMKDILPRILEADGFIFGSPARWSLLSGELKTFIDRLNPIAAAESLKGKMAVIFAVGQTKGKDALSIGRTADSIKFFCENAGIEVVDTVIAKGCLNRDDLITKYPAVLARCKKAALNLFKKMRSAR